MQAMKKNIHKFQ